MSLEEWQTVFHPAEECELPCWLGIVPGTTSLNQAADIILARFEGLRDPRERDDPTPERMAFIGPGMNLDGSGELLVRVTSIDLKADDGIVQVIETDFVGDAVNAGEYFTLTDMLDIYGVPDLVMMEAWQDEEVGLLALSLVLDWQSVGLSISYDRTYEAVNLGGLDCFHFDQLSGIEVYLYLPGELTVQTAADEGDYVNRFPDELSKISDLSNVDLVEILLQHDGCLPNNLRVSTWDEQRPLRLGIE
jgi:hypothetical protein